MVSFFWRAFLLFSIDTQHPAVWVSKCQRKNRRRRNAGAPYFRSSRPAASASSRLENQSIKEYRGFIKTGQIKNHNSNGRRGRNTRRSAYLNEWQVPAVGSVNFGILQLLHPRCGFISSGSTLNFWDIFA
jgi:hypothetical protein